MELRTLIDRAAQHSKSTTISNDDFHYGQKILKDCQGVLEDLNSLFEKFNRLASTNKRFIFGGHTGVVTVLLSKGASIEAKNQHGHTPLITAASRGHPEVLELLLMKGASIEATNNSRNTPLHLAA